jgi:Ran-binding protein 1
VIKHLKSAQTTPVSDLSKNIFIQFAHLRPPVTSEMNLQPNIGSDRSWVWKTLADMAEGEPSAETLAIRFANSDSEQSCRAEYPSHTHME